MQNLNSELEYIRNIRENLRIDQLRAACAEAFLSRRPPFPMTAVVESSRNLTQAVCSTVPFVLGIPEASFGRTLYFNRLPTLLTELLQAYVTSGSTSGWVLPTNLIASLDLIAGRLQETVASRPSSIPAKIDISATIAELAELRSGNLSPPGTHLLKDENRPTEIANKLAAAIQNPNWKGYEPFQLAEVGTSALEMPLEKPEGEGPMASILFRLNNSRFRNEELDKERQRLADVLNAVLNVVATKVVLLPADVRSMANLFGPQGLPYFRWALALELGLQFQNAKVSVALINRLQAVKGLDYANVVPKLVPRIETAATALIAGQEVSDLVGLTVAMSEKLNPNLGRKPNKKVYVEAHWKSYLDSYRYMSQLAKCYVNLAAD